MLNNTKIKERGFTIVELLIVIVVIAILAAISIVAYTGIQNRAKTSTAQSLAAQIQKKAEAWNTVQSGYPTFEQFYTNSLAPTGTGTAAVAAGGSGPAEAKLDDATKIATTAPSSESTVMYKQCTATSAQVTWRDATAGAVKYIGMGGASSTTAC